LKAIAINPAPRKKRRAPAKKKNTTTRRKKTMAARKRAPAKKNPTRKSPRRNQAGKFKLTGPEVKNLTGAAAGGAMSGAVTSYIDGMKPDFLQAVPSAVITAGIGVVLVAMSRQPVAKAIGGGMVAHAVGDMVEEFMQQPGSAGPSPETKAKEALVFSNPGHYNSLQHNPGHYSAHSKNVGALVTF
jgi:hypothetical protein